MKTLDVFNTPETMAGGILSCRQVAVLAYAAQWPDRSVRQVAEKIGISKPAVTRALDRLGDLQLVTRNTDPNDKRCVRIKATAKGQKIVSKIEDIIRG